MTSYVIGIDVGTGSVRGALVTKSGEIVKTHSEQITTWNPKPKYYQQSSNEIWSLCCNVIKQLTRDISPNDVKGLGFDATCSLAVLDSNGDPISVNVNDDAEQNIILWMDHRANKEADLINETKHPILRYAGGKVSLEMMVPKIRWLKNNHPECWKEAEFFFLLPDFLTWRATNNDYRSLCSVVCKCNYENNAAYSGWNKEYFDVIGLQELSQNNWKKIGSKIIKPGELCGELSERAARETGLVSGTPVAASLIDAHAGGLGVMGCTAKNIPNDFTSRLALVCGTSTCHMAQSINEVYVPGVWGPFLNAMLPGLWLLEAGQSVSGKLIDHIIDTHPASQSVKRKCIERANIHITQYLNDILDKIAESKGLNSVDELTNEIHIWPDFHGNRSPIADPNLRGMILGLTMACDEENLAVIYLATIQALAYGTKHIIDAMCHAGHKNIQSVIICGGVSKNKLFVDTHANAIGLPILIPEQTESVLLGAAQLGAAVAGFYDNLDEAVCSMAGPAEQVKPNLDTASYHEKKYQVFLEMLSHQRCCQTIMNS
ncbi:FGGY carbohydrate kinase domain-containing protein-like [Planococcus citri]|uniref:FGGY carbohydrate kinase domain-containing protein-like n=1 Tax=Planococcus citri TaxID=170843 RepID=UPI0031F90483